MITCTNCNGEGIVGQGDKPWLQQGHKETCKRCSGTGKVDETAAAKASQEAPAEDTSTPAQDAPVDNQPAPKEDGSPDGSGDKASTEAFPA